MVAEKFETMVRLGVANSRMKDFYDIWLMSRLLEFNGRTLCDAILNTFKRRSTPLPLGLPMPFTDEFRKDAQKQTQWRAFVRKSKPEDMPGSLDTLIDHVAAFLMPVMEAIKGNESVGFYWPNGGSWMQIAKD
jgi:hypothetical protein